MIGWRERRRLAGWVGAHDALGMTGGAG